MTPRIVKLLWSTWIVLPTTAGVTTIMTLPELVAQHSDGLRIFPIGCIGRHKVSAQQRVQAQKLEVGSRHLDNNVTPSGTSLPCDRLVRIVGGNHILDSVCLTQLPNLRPCQAPGVLAASIVGEPHIRDSLHARIGPRDAARRHTGCCKRPR